MIAINFVAPLFLGGFFCYATQAKVRQNVVATPFLGGFFLPNEGIMNFVSSSRVWSLVFDMKGRYPSESSDYTESYWYLLSCTRNFYGMQMNWAQNIVSNFWQARSSLLLEHSHKIDLEKIYLLCSMPQCLHRCRNSLLKGVWSPQYCPPMILGI